MREAQHEAIARWERRWLAVSGLLLVVFVIFIAYSLTIEGGHIAQQSERATPEQILQRDLFTDPGVVQTGPGTYRVSMTAQAFAFSPGEVRLPAGAEATFYMTSRDVLHGFQIADTSVNVELIPGEVATFRYTFDEPGSYRVTCNEYCGIGHQNMISTIEVLEPRAYAQQAAAAEEEARAEAEGEPGGPLETSLATGEGVYADNCASCHGADGRGIPGTFPPVRGHAPDLFTAEGGREYLATVILHGLEGPIQVEGDAYDGVMPAWQQLSDAQIAGVSNYLLGGWDDADFPGDAEPFTAEEIAPLRGRDASPADVHDMREALELEP